MNTGSRNGTLPSSWHRYAPESLQSRLQPRDFLTGLTTCPPPFAFLLPGHKATIPRDIKIPRTLFASHSLTHRPAIPPDLLRHLSLYFIELGLIEKKSLCIFLSNIPRLIINSPFVPGFDILKFWVTLKKRVFVVYVYLPLVLKEMPTGLSKQSLGPEIHCEINEKADSCSQW